MLNRSKYNPADYTGKKLMAFENESEGHLYSLSTFTSEDGKTFELFRTAAGPAAGHQIAIVKDQIDESTLKLMEHPNSRFLNNQCDFVFFQNSPKRKAQYTETEA
jgi:hypothetical protein